MPHRLSQRISRVSHVEIFPGQQGVIVHVDDQCDRFPSIDENQRLTSLSSGRIDMGDIAVELGTAPEWIFACCGFSMLMTWNAAVNCIPYFESALTASDSAIVSAFLAPAFSYPQLIIMAVVLPLWGRHVSHAARICVPLVFQTALLASLPFVVKYGGAPALLGVIAVCGGLTAVLDASLFGLAGVLPARFGSLLMSGNGAAGVAACAVNIAAQVALPNAPTTAAYVFLAAASAVQLMTAAAFAWLVAQPSIAMHVKLLSHAAERGSRRTNTLDSMHDHLLAKPVDAAHAAVTASVASPAAAQQESRENYSLPARQSIHSSGSVASVSRSGTASFWRAVGPAAACVVLALAGTFVTYPALCPYGMWPSGEFHLSVRWYRMTLLMLVQVADLAGRLLAVRFAPFVIQSMSPMALLGVCAARIALFTPLAVYAARDVMPFNNDFIVAAATAVNNVAGGFLASTSMALGPAAATEAGLPAASLERAGFACVLALQIGILVGSQASVGVSLAVDPSRGGRSFVS